MGKGNGNTRGSSSGSPRGLNNSGSSLSSIRSQIVQAINTGGADWNNPELVQLRSQEERTMRDELNALAGTNGWEKGFLNIKKEYDSDSPITIMDVSVSTYNSGIENGPYYQVRVGSSKVSSNSNYTDEVNALWNNDRQFKSAREAVRWAESQAARINRKYKGKI